MVAHNLARVARALALGASVALGASLPPTLDATAQVDAGRGDAETAPTAASRVRARELFTGSPRLPTSDPERVVVMLRDAYARTPHPMLLLNLAMAQHALRRYCEAASTFERYLARHSGHSVAASARARRYRAEALRRGRCRRAASPDPR